MGYLLRQAILGALLGNAVRPSSGMRGAVPSFVAGWLTNELAAQAGIFSAVDTLREGVRRHRREQSFWPLAVGLVTTGACAGLVRQGRHSGPFLEGVLAESLGADYRSITVDDVAADDNAAVPWRAVARPFHLRDREVEVIRNINYTEGGRRAKLDIYRPKGADLDNAPVLVQVHGGGWTIGSKEEQGLLLMNRMAKAGWVCVAVNYRLAPKHPWPAQIIDVKRSLAWIHEHIADYGGDPSYIAITGGSAGGHLSSLAALTPGLAEYQPGFEDADTSVQACVPFYGVYDLAGITKDRHAEQMRDAFLAPRVFKKDPVKDLADFELASPMAHLDDGALPDFFVLHGSKDTLVSVNQARAFVKALRERDAAVTYAELPGAQHAFEIFSSYRSQHAVRAVQRWLWWHYATTMNTRAQAGKHRGSVAG